MKEAYYIFDGLTPRRAKILKAGLYTIPGITRVRFHIDNGTVIVEYEDKKPTEHMLKMAGIYAKAPLRVEVTKRSEIRRILKQE